MEIRRYVHKAEREKGQLTFDALLDGVKMTDKPVPVGLVEEPLPLEEDDDSWEDEEEEEEDEAEDEGESVDDLIRQLLEGPYSREKKIRGLMIAGFPMDLARTMVDAPSVTIL